MADSAELDLSPLPPIYIIPANIPEDELHSAEDTVHEYAGQLSYLPTEAKIFLSRISQRKRAAFELRSRGVWTEESSLPRQHVSKKRKLSSSYVEGNRENVPDGRNDEMEITHVNTLLSDLNNHVVVLKLDWLQQSIKAGHLLPFQPFQIYSGRTIDNPKPIPNAQTPPVQPLTIIKVSPDTDEEHAGHNPQALEHKLSAAAAALDHTSLPTMRFVPRRFRDQKRGRYNPSSTIASISVPTHPRLHRTTTSEHDFIATDLPPAPPWLTEKSPRPNYACMRSTFADPPNSAFLSHLYKIKEARILTLDEIGVRAYSTAIASLSAYPHIITNPAEITLLPGCSDKIAALWQEWYTSSPDDLGQRKLNVTDALDNDEDLKHLKLFYDIWGVGAETARKFYFEHGWKDLDDVVEYGWNDTLSRVQQIGVKFYDEFKVKIPREEVEKIADIILHHARLCKDVPEEVWSNSAHDYGGNWNKPDDGNSDPDWDPRDMVCVIVGGYRRGKKECGDVDVILSHRDEAVTKDLVIDVVRSLETSGHVTHTLTLHTTHSDRDQQTLPFRSAGHAGHGFDTLDKALCVWQDPEYDTTTTANENEQEKNPNIHRRVDIIISPWRTVGAAVLGWSGATTFERDVRRWCRKEKGWKFDSSGVRDRATGGVLDFETSTSSGKRKPIQTLKGKEKAATLLEDNDVEDVGDGWEDRERRLMEGLGIGWRPARERCTG